MNHDPASERLRAMASEMEASTTPERADMIAARSLARARVAAPGRRSLVAAVAGAALAFAGAMGVGAIADTAAPGQAIYGVDRAYESAARFVGVKSDRSAERLEEALKVIDRGDRAAAAKLVDEAVAELQRVQKLSAPAAPTTTVPTAPPSTSAPQISAAPAAPAEDPSQTLKLAVERLLRSVRGTDSSDLEAAATDAVAAATAATAPEPDVVVEGSTTTTTTIPDSTTTTIVPSSTTTTVDDGNNGRGNNTTTTSSTTTTTLPPIILPPQP